MGSPGCSHRALDRKRMTDRPTTVAIIGAGVAGLSAAQRAHELGIDAIVLEASNRIGGRVQTVERADGSVWDRGAHWLRQVPVNPFVAEAERRSSVTAKPWQTA